MAFVLPKGIIREIEKRTKVVLVERHCRARMPEGCMGSSLQTYRGRRSWGAGYLSPQLGYDVPKALGGHSE
ncbi:UNVERIFIED_CONTAM: hypothetical protein Slati_1515000 [Sesamum latifolium]|uniref:Uncharacterized protein n=1 Tax=Sesamum latifolium TaxID=2727402 RepID=A0AAW2X7I6_9LAMI